MFRTDLLSIIRSFNTVFTAIGICHTEVLKMGKITSVYIYIYIYIYLCNWNAKYYKSFVESVTNQGLKLEFLFEAYKKALEGMNSGNNNYSN